MKMERYKPDYALGEIVTLKKYSNNVCDKDGKIIFYDEGSYYMIIGYEGTTPSNYKNKYFPYLWAHILNLSDLRTGYVYCGSGTGSVISQIEDFFMYDYEKEEIGDDLMIQESVSP